MLRHIRPRIDKLENITQCFLEKDALFSSKPFCFCLVHALVVVVGIFAARTKVEIMRAPVLIPLSFMLMMPCSFAAYSINTTNISVPSLYTIHFIPAEKPVLRITAKILIIIPDCDCDVTVSRREEHTASSWWSIKSWTTDDSTLGIFPIYLSFLIATSIHQHTSADCRARVQILNCNIIIFIVLLYWNLYNCIHCNCTFGLQLVSQSNRTLATWPCDIFRGDTRWINFGQDHHPLLIFKNSNYIISLILSR